MHTHFEGVGIAGPVTGAGMPDFYTEYHALTGAAMFGHFASILCHGIFERFPRSRVMFMEGGLVPFVGLLWRLDTAWRGCRTEVPHCVRPPSEYVHDHLAWTTQPLEEPPENRMLAPALEGLQPQRTLCFSSDYPHWDFDDPRQTLNGSPPNGATRSPTTTPPASSTSGPRCGMSRPVARISSPSCPSPGGSA